MTANYTSIFADTVESKFGVELDIQYPLCPSRFVVWGLLFYVASIVFFQPHKKVKPKQIQQQSSTQGNVIKKKKQRTFGPIEAVIFVHNLVLAIFSLLCFINTAPIVYNLFATYGFSEGICKFHTIYDSEVSTFGYWSYLFYLSKYWEFIDTWIVIARGRRPIFLQEYHHIGAVIGMWAITITKSSAGYLFIVQNSFIHTVMYTYYAFSVIGYKFPLKNWITILQMIQFINGIGLCMIQLCLYSSCLSIADVICQIYLLGYVIYLFYLFMQFYQRTYKKRAKKQV